MGAFSAERCTHPLFAETMAAISSMLGHALNKPYASAAMGFDLLAEDTDAALLGEVQEKVLGSLRLLKAFAGDLAWFSRIPAISADKDLPNYHPGHLFSQFADELKKSWPDAELPAIEKHWSINADEDLVEFALRKLARGMALLPRSDTSACCLRIGQPELGSLQVSCTLETGLQVPEHPDLLFLEQSMSDETLPDRLGLALACCLIQAVKGRVAVRGMGTCFEVQLEFPRQET